MTGASLRLDPGKYQDSTIFYGRHTVHYSGLLIFRGKKAKFRGIFRGKFAEKSAKFAGKKSKFADKSAHFAGFWQKKVKFPRIFRGKFLENSAGFTGNFGGKLRQETISKKQPISLDFLGANLAKIDQFCVDMTSVF